MAPLGALVAVPVIALAVHHRRMITAVVSGLAAVLPWALVVGYATGDERPPAGAQGVRIMLVNSNEGQVDAEGVVAAVRQHGVDVLVINELTSMLAHDLTKAGIGGILRAQYVSDQQGGHAPGQFAGQLGVWSRPDVTDAGPVPGTSMPAMSGTIQTAAGPIRLVAGHSPRPNPGVTPFGDASVWAADLDALARAGEGSDPRLLVGDLNATPWNQQFRQLEKTSGLSDAADVLGKGLRPTWPVWSPMPLSPIDHVLVGGGVGVRSVGTANVPGSNHRALVVEVTAPAGR
jgi:endonuclease/exonuclease/phosphatase (EEP) superfamily protein YafD